MIRIDLVAMFGGAALVVYGVALIFPPAAWIVAGCLLILMSAWKVK